MKKAKGSRGKRSKVQSKAAKVSTRTRKSAEQTDLKANGKAIDDGRERLEKVERLEAQRQNIKSERAQLGVLDKQLDAQQVAEIERAVEAGKLLSPCYRTDTGRLITIDIKKRAKSKAPPKGKGGRKRKQSAEAKVLDLVVDAIAGA